jgi:predicted amidophosphoribosyltransferase
MVCIYCGKEITEEDISGGCCTVCGTELDPTQF